jgi:hypothetical protein
VRDGTAVQSIELAVLSLWLGAAVLVATTVAPAAFAVLPSRALAGALVGRVLSVVFLGGIAAAIIAVLCEMRVSQHAFSLTVSAPLIALAAGCAIGQFVITPRIERIRAAAGGSIDALALADPQRVMFGRLHAFSVLCLGVAMLGAAVTIGMRIHRSRQLIVSS